MTTPRTIPAPPTPPLTKEQFAREFTQAARPLWCIAVSILRDADHARDVVQDAAIVGLERLDQFRPGTNFVHWMGQIVRFVALNEGRREKFRAARSGDALLSAPSPQGARVPELALARHADETFDDDTAAALNELDEAPRACLLMRTVLGMSYRQIAEALDIAEGTAMSHVHRSRHRMRESLLARASRKEVGR